MKEGFVCCKGYLVAAYGDKGQLIGTYPTINIHHDRAETLIEATAPSLGITAVTVGSHNIPHVFSANIRPKDKIKICIQRNNITEQTGLWELD